MHDPELSSQVCLAEHAQADPPVPPAPPDPPVPPVPPLLPPPPSDPPMAPSSQNPRSQYEPLGQSALRTQGTSRSSGSPPGGGLHALRAVKKARVVRRMVVGKGRMLTGPPGSRCRAD